MNTPPTHKGEKLPPEPLTAAELAEIRERNAYRMAVFAMVPRPQADLDCNRLLAEVARLQTQLGGL